MASSPEDVYKVLLAYSKGEKSWEEVKAIATGVKYGRPEKSPWGDIDLSVVTFNDAVAVFRLSKKITPEQIEELRSLGVFGA